MTASLFAGCAKEEAKPTETKTETATETKEEEKEEMAEEEVIEIYIPVISKGFQHQFWQAVKKKVYKKQL